MINNPSHPKKGHLKTKDCKFSKAGVEFIDYKDTETLLKFMNDQGKILPRRVTGTSAKHQRMLSRAIKQARFMALIPFVAENLR
ncbi:MAG: 30S ribosomal protein S18 [Bacteroidetes bacterium]|jgi:small subunit ribosomal protein S18|nr:30S ribosomal protein S18 [Bacteroidota bacterium]PTM12748.1 MAG: 30S ribosomal protein S18 [Bacteroidota bacterium]PTM20482.1 MAG: 30S ribosomal protein S18 [Bacteroidota bacterium]